MKSRMLNVLDINDEPSQAFKSGEGRAKHFVVDRITTWKEAQRVLAGVIKKDAPDLILLDVSFNKDASVKGTKLDQPGKQGNPIYPVGPFLALPFLNTKLVMGFAPYSAHFEDEYLTKYPPFLVAMGLIAAKMNGSIFGSKYLSLNNEDDTLGTFIEDLKSNKTASNTDTALEIAIELYRNNFFKAIKDKRLSLFKNKEIMESLNELDQRLNQSKGKVKLPSDWGLEVIDSQGNQDCISIVSLFADVLSWNTWADRNAFDKIYDNIKEAPEDLTVKAIKAVEKQDEEQKSLDGTAKRENANA